jgi:hypothetical protein
MVRLWSFINSWPKVAFLLLILLVVLAYFIVRHFMVIDELIKRSQEGEPSDGWHTTPSMLMPWDLSAAEAHIDSYQDHRSYHLLFAIRKRYPGAYERIPDKYKASILCAALTHAPALNEWGYLMKKDCREGEPAQALVETGVVAIPFLKSLLDDHRPALLEGSQAATLSLSYKYRIADFAHRYICLILSWGYDFHDTPEQRDVEITKIKGKLEEREKAK